MFLHEKNVPDAKDQRYGCPEQCPSGLFGNTLRHLVSAVDHKDSRWGKSGMVYWNRESLILLSELDALLRPASESFSFERVPIAGLQEILTFNRDDVDPDVACP